jgi:alkanesulfonate monooxygenase SsuD/methylene tetrahydromethanopterin reductase-like flavin-dependent oxidoreductase (luciferase family)
MARTARLGDGWLPAWLKPKDIGACFRKVKEMARQNGRDPEKIELGIEVYVSIDDNSRVAKKNALGTFQASRATYERDMSIDFLQQVSLIGSPQEIRDQIAAYREAGVSHFELKFIYPTIDRLSEMMRFFSEEILGKV